MLETTKCHRVVWGAHRVRATDGVVHGACVLSYCSRPLNATVVGGGRAHRLRITEGVAHGPCVRSQCSRQLNGNVGFAHRVRIAEDVVHGPCVLS